MIDPLELARLAEPYDRFANALDRLSPDRFVARRQRRGRGFCQFSFRTSGAHQRVSAKELRTPEAQGDLLHETEEAGRSPGLRVLEQNTEGVYFLAR